MKKKIKVSIARFPKIQIEKAFSMFSKQQNAEHFKKIENRKK